MAENRIEAKRGTIVSALAHLKSKRRDPGMADEGADEATDTAVAAAVACVTAPITDGRWTMEQKGQPPDGHLCAVVG